jgi:diaminohydroxyphosphoribosylaminopyrimidine deaminase/5-amino-6-(5-phosphoribosylamino)uracil reductase
MLFVTESAPIDRIEALHGSGINVLTISETNSTAGSDRIDLNSVLDELARQSMTNVLVEGGSEVLGSFFDQQLIDELHVFMAPKLVGGHKAKTAVGARGLDAIPELPQLRDVKVQMLDGDIYVNGRIKE